MATKKKKTTTSNPIWWIMLIVGAVLTFTLRRPLTAEPLLSAAVAVLSAVLFFVLGRSVMFDDKKAFFAAVVLLTMHGFIGLGRASSALLPSIALAVSLAGGLLYIVGFEPGQKGIMVLGGLLSGGAFAIGGFAALLGTTLPLLLSYLVIWRPSMKGRWGMLGLSLVAGVVAVALYGLWLHYFDGLSLDKVLSMWKFAPAALSAATLERIARVLGVWTLPVVVVLFAPLYSAPERQSVEFKFFLLWLVLSLAAALFFPPVAGVMLPAALMVGYVAVRWDESLKRKKNSMDGTSTAIIVNAVALGAAVLVLTGLTLYRHSAAVGPAVTGILGVTAVAVAVYIISSIWRRGSSDSVIGMGLFALISEILLQPSLWIL